MLEAIVEGDDLSVHCSISTLTTKYRTLQTLEETEGQNKDISLANQLCSELLYRKEQMTGSTERTDDPAHFSLQVCTVSVLDQNPASSLDSLVFCQTCITVIEVFKQIFKILSF